MIKNARSSLENVKNDKFDRVKVRGKFISKNEIINFLKKIIKGYINDNNKLKEYSIKFLKAIIKGYINDNNKLKEYSTNLKSIRSTLNNASKKVVI